MSNGVTLQIVGADDVAAWMEKYGEDVTREVAKIVARTALKVDRRVKKAIQRGPKTGTIYMRGKGQNLGRKHQASKGGANPEAPATDTGALVSSIYFKQVSRLSAEVGSRLAYAAALEWGTSRMDARPAWQPAVAAEMPDFERAVRDAMQKATKK
jgi:HK97 gp10 family phage protein